jgi:TPR repeat protein
MNKRVLIGGVILAAQILGSLVLGSLVMGSHGAVAGPWEDGMAAYNRGDYVPAVKVFRAMAAQGDAKAQSLLGVMYRRGQGVVHSPVHAFLWLSRAASRGDARAKTELHEVTQTMTPEQLSQARGMSQACEASNDRDCEY